MIILKNVYSMEIFICPNFIFDMWNYYVNIYMLVDRYYHALFHFTYAVDYRIDLFFSIGWKKKCDRQTNERKMKKLANTQSDFYSRKKYLITLVVSLLLLYYFVRSMLTHFDISFSSFFFLKTDASHI